MSKSKHSNGTEADNTTRNFLLIVGAIFVFFIFVMYKNFTNPDKGTVAENVHWHLPITYEICGEKQLIKEKQTHGLLHGHEDETVHVEGLFDAEKSAPIKAFFDAIDVPFSATQIGQYENGDVCPESTTPGKVSFFVNGSENLEYENHIIRGNDSFLIKFE